jgi:3-isopropylmalate/(R)-2-methylmalate dehydratase small subunit
MSDLNPRLIEGRAAALRIENLDTDQIMPKQFLRGIDKSGLAPGVLYDQRFDAQGQPRPDFVLNRPDYADTRILVGGANFGCGSSREHAVWGLQQFGIRAVIAPSFGEIFYSNALNNGLLVVMLPEPVVAALMRDADDVANGQVRIDVQALTVCSAGGAGCDRPVVDVPAADRGVCCGALGAASVAARCRRGHVGASAPVNRSGAPACCGCT